MPKVLELHDPDGSAGPPRKSTSAPGKKSPKRPSKKADDAGRWKQIVYAIAMVAVTVVALVFVIRELAGGRPSSGTNPPPPGRAAAAHPMLPPAPMMRPAPYRRPVTGSPAPVLPSSGAPAPANAAPSTGSPGGTEGDTGSANE